MADLFRIRVAGVSFDILTALGTPASAAAARALVAAQKDVETLCPTAIHNAVQQGLTGVQARTVRQAVAGGKPLPAELKSLAALAPLLAAMAQRQTARLQLTQHFHADRERVDAQVVALALRELPEFAAMQSDSAYQELQRLQDKPPKDRWTLRTLAMYLQRVAAKNDTISRFGPVGWGRVVPGAPAIQLTPQPGIVRRTVSIERWVAVALAAAMNADPEVRVELAPRLHPSGGVEGDLFVRHDSGQQVALSAADKALLARIDGTAAAHQLGELDAVARLAASGVLIWEQEPVAMDSTPLETFRDDVAKWRPGAPQQRWAERLSTLAATVASYGEERDAAGRWKLAASVNATITGLGGKLSTKAGLYSARNPIVEDCYRDCGMVLGGELVASLVADLNPWVDLFRDTFSLAARVAFDHLRPVYQAAKEQRRPLSLAAFLSAAERAGYSLSGAGYPLFGAMAFRRVKELFRAATAQLPADAEEWQLTPEMCHAVRRSETFPLVDEFTWPSADLQLSARSPAAVARGEYEWVAAELHQGGIGFLLYSSTWCCPDPDRLAHFAGRFAAGKPFLAHSHALFNGPVHLAHEPYMKYLPAPRFVAAERGKPAWHSVAPAATEVVIDEAACDLRVRALATGEDLGSLVRTPKLFQGFHPFFPLELEPHTPRLRLGKTIVQRRTWRVDFAELELANLKGLDEAALAAVERLRTRRGLPRWVYGRAALMQGTYGPVGADKDRKPIYLDLESLIFVEIFLWKLKKWGHLYLSEMLPSPENLLWQEPAGRFSFELRTLLVQAR